MRVVAGTLRSRKIEAVEGMETRPTADKIKEAVFSRIGPYFQGGRMLDCYAGSGNVGIEAYSRGIEHVVCADSSRKAIQTIKKNLTTLKIAPYFEVHERKIEEVIEQCHQKGYVFDLIYMDPPYRSQKNEELIQKISDYDMLSEDGVIVIESLKEDSFSEKIGQYECVKSATYGITKISYYYKQGE